MGKVCFSLEMAGSKLSQSIRHTS